MSKRWACRVYYNVNPIVGLSVHEVPLPPLMVPAPLPHIECDVVQGLWLGSFLSLGRHKSITSDHLLMVGRMSDAGMVVPHVSIPPSPWNLLTTLFGMSNSIWGSSSSVAACKNLMWGNQDCDIAATPFGKVPLSLNLCCSEPVCMPTDIVFLWGTVYVGMSWSDIGAAMIDVAIFVATDVLMKVAGHYAGPLKDSLKSGMGKLAKGVAAAGAKVVEKAGTMFAKEAAEDAGDEFVEKFGDEALEQGEKKGLVRSAADKLGEVAGAAGEKMRSVASDIGDALSPAAEAVGERMKALSDAVGDKVSDLRDAVSPALDAVGERMRAVGDAVGERASAAREALKDAFQPITDAFTGDANAVYARKAAKLVGMADAVGASEDDLAKLADEAGSKSSDLVGNLKENLADFLESHTSRVKGLNAEFELGAREVSRESDYLTKMGAEGMTDAANARLLKDSIQDLDDAVSRVAAQNTAWILLKKSASLVFGKILWSNVVRRGNLLGDGTTGGVFSFGGLHVTSMFHSHMEMADRGYKDEHEAEDYWYETQKISTTVQDYVYEKG